MRITSNGRPLPSPFRSVRAAHGLIALLLLGACAGDDGSNTANNPVVAPPGIGGSTSPVPVAGSASPAGTGGMIAVGSGGSIGAAGQGAGTGGAAAQPAGTGGAGGVTTAGTGGMTAGAGGMMAPTGGAGGGAPQMSSGCGKAPPASDTSIMVGSQTGSYILDLPSNYDNTKPYPLVFSWHGFNVTNTSFHSYLNLQAVIGDEAILVTPECLNGGSMWPSDMAYPDALIEHFESNYCIDTGRLFTTGHSMGGMYTGQIGCQRGDKFRGNAVLAAPHPNGTCVEGNMAAMMSVGDSDFVADGTTEFPWWAESNGCDASMSMPVADAMQCVEYAGCEPGKPVRTCSFSGGHEIPSWTAAAVWGFFKSL